MKYVVTGGAGFIGTNLVTKLVADGHEVVVVDDLSAGDSTRLPVAIEFHQLDIRNTEELGTVFNGADVVVHLAALPRVQTSIDEPVAVHDVNINGTLSVLEAARAAKVGRVVFAASSAAYGDQETLPLSLDLPPEPKSPYAMHKCVGELMMKTWATVYGLETVSLRFFNVYGPHFDPDGPYALVIGKFLKLKSEDKPLTITGDGSQTRDFVHVDDVIEAIILSAMSNRVGKGEVLNVGKGKQTSINELADMIGGTKEYVEARLEPKHTLADVSLTSELLGWQPTRELEVSIESLKKDMGIV